MELGEMIKPYVDNLLSSIQKTIAGLEISDTLDILLVTVALYYIITLLRRSNAFNVFKGILIFLGITAVASVLNLTTLSFILQNTMQVGLFGILVMFQPELRRALETVGASGINVLKRDETTLESAIPQTVDACTDMSRTRTGALIVFQRTVELSDYLKTGTRIDASVTSELLKNIFYPKAPLHDGAVIVVGGRIAGAGCVLPLTGNPNLSKELGTRHKAGIGVSENSDAVVVIVSEETGVISVAIGGLLKRHLAPETLEKLLSNELLPNTQQQEQRGVQKLLGRFKRKKHE